MSSLALKPIPTAKHLGALPGMEYIRDLAMADLARLGEEELGVQQPMLTRLKHRHHSLARALAQGMSPGHAAAVCGYSFSRVSILQNDPAFAELVNYYKTQAEEKFRDAVAKRAELHETVIDELQQRLDQEPDKFSKKELTDLLTATTPSTPGGHRAPELPPGLAINIQFKEPVPREMIDISPEKREG